MLFTRERHRKGVRYFGPYASASKVRETLDVLNRVFPYRPCEGPEPGRRSGIPCLDYHIGRCLGPCVGYVSEEGYRELIDGIIEFLEGRSGPIERELAREMKSAATERRYEDAARARNRLEAVRHLRERQLVDRPGVGDIDVFGIAQEGDLATVLILPLRGGRLGDRFTFMVENAAASSPDELVLLAAEERYGGPNGSVPPLVCVPAELEEGELIGELLSEWRGGRVEMRVPERGNNRKLLELAQTNAAHALAEARLQGERTRLRRFGALEELREVLNLESLPLRIECFDISNTWASRRRWPRWSCSSTGMPKKADYRIFGIERTGRARTTSRRCRRPCAAVHAARERRLGRQRLRPVGSPPCPNLVVIDGGKGQLTAALGGARRSTTSPRGGRDRPRQADGGGLRAGPLRRRSC